jgi:hypothetical protein
LLRIPELLTLQPRTEETSTFIDWPSTSITSWTSVEFMYETAFSEGYLYVKISVDKPLFSWDKTGPHTSKILKNEADDHKILFILNRFCKINLGKILIKCNIRQAT